MRRLKMASIVAGALLGLFLMFLWGCQGSSVAPALLDTAHDACGFCRMVVSDARFASEIVAPNEEPRFFDDMGCLKNYLGSHPALPMGARVYVADHRTKQWVSADVAVYTGVDSTAPMGSHFVAHASAASRDADASVTGGRPVSLSDVLPSRSGSQP